MKNYCISLAVFILLMTTALAGVAQPKLGIVQAKAYRQLEIPGNIPEGDQHKAPDTLYKVFVEVLPNSRMIWQSVRIGNADYSVIARKSISPLKVGTASNGESEIFTAKKGNLILQLNLTKNEVSSFLSKPQSDNCPVRLKVKIKKRFYFYCIKQIKELQPELHM